MPGVRPLPVCHAVRACDEPDRGRSPILITGRWGEEDHAAVAFAQFRSCNTSTSSGPGPGLPSRSWRA
jgi:hypothetical protein